MKKLLAAIASVFMLLGCSAPSSFEVKKPAPTKNVDSRCFEVFVQAYATGESNGAYDCLSDDLQYTYFMNRGIKDDKGLNTFLRYSKTITGAWDVQQWQRPIPKAVFAGRDAKQQFVPGSNDVTRAYFMYPIQSDGSIGYFTNGYSFLITIDPSGKVVDIE